MPETELTRAFLKHKSDLNSYITGRLKCSATANDLCHEIYFRALRVEDASSIKNLRSYLFKIASNLIKDHTRNETRRSKLIEQTGDVLFEKVEPRSPEDFLLARDELNRLLEIMKTLPEATRGIFYAHRFEGKTRQEIATQFGITPSTVDYHVKRVLTKIVEELEE